MAQDKADKTTIDLFSQEEKDMLTHGMATHLATLRRRINSEEHPDIKAIRQNELREYVALCNKIQGL